MKSLKIIIATTLVGLISLTAAMSQTQLVKDLMKGKDRTLTVYGTSITKLGNGPIWVEKVGSELNDEFKGNLTLYNRGGSGRNSQWATMNLADSVLVTNPDAVIIEFSVNDAVTRFDMSPEQSIKNTEYLIRKIKEQNPNAEVILLVVAVYPVGEAAEKRPDLKDYIEGYRTMAAEHQLLLIDFTSTWDGMIAKGGEKAMRRHLHDGVHTTKKGSEEVIAPTVLKALKGEKID